MAPKTENPAKMETLSELRNRMSAEQQRAPVEQKPEPHVEKPIVWPTAEMKDKGSPPGMVVIDGDRGPIKAEARPPGKGGGSPTGQAVGEAGAPFTNASGQSISPPACGPVSRRSGRT